VKPASALKGGDNPHSRRRLMHALIAAQVAFCFLVILVASLFVATFEHLSHQRTGFSSERLLNLETVATPARETAYWEEVAERLRAAPGVENVALANRPLLNGYQSNNFLSINGGPPTEQLAFFLNVSPGWLDALKIPLIDGRDFRPGEMDTGVAIVNETFAKTFFNGANPVGKSFERANPKHIPFEIVGLVRDAKYSNIREPNRPVFYLPIRRAQPVRVATFVVRTVGANPLALASAMRREVRRARPEFRVSNIRTQQEIIDSQTLRERLLAMLGMFFGAVALLLAGIGLYGVLNYSVVQRRREIGIRLAFGAPSGVIARLVTFDIFTMVLAGAIAGLALGMASIRYIETLFYQVKATDVRMLMLPSLAILTAALLASLPAVLHAVHIDPVKTLRSE
jgi:predicted permease